MKLTVIIIAVCFAQCSLASDGLFTPIDTPPPSEKLEGTVIVTRIPSKRVDLVRATFRTDSDDKQKYLIELDFAEYHDPGDYYFFQLNGERYGGFVVRGNGGLENGCRWALEFKDVDKGRAFLDAVGRAYNLKASSIFDKTKNG